MTDFEVRSSDLWDEARFTMPDDGDGLTMEGPMAMYATPSTLLSELDLPTKSRSQLGKFGTRTFREIIEPGAFAKTLSENPDIVLHYQHNENTLPLGRTRAGTLVLTDESTRVNSRAHFPDNTWGRDVAVSVKRRDIPGISFRMGGVRESWSRELLADGYDGPVRRLHEVRLRREMSLVTFPAYETAASIRELAEAADVEPDALSEAFKVLHQPDAKLTDDQHQLLQTAIAAKVDAPYINPKLASMRERLEAALAR